MSALDDLKDRIDSAIYTNTEQNITGDGLQTVLDDMVDTMGVSVSQNPESGKTQLLIGGTPVLTVDFVPQSGSKNLAESDGIYNLTHIPKDIWNVTLNNGYYNEYGHLQGNSDFDSCQLELIPGHTYKIIQQLARNNVRIYSVTDNVYTQIECIAGDASIPMDIVYYTCPNVDNYILQVVLDKRYTGTPIIFDVSESETVKEKTIGNNDEIKGININRWNITSNNGFLNADGDFVINERYCSCLLKLIRGTQYKVIQQVYANYVRIFQYSNDEYTQIDVYGGSVGDDIVNYYCPDDDNIYYMQVIFDKDNISTYPNIPQILYASSLRDTILSIISNDEDIKSKEIKILAIGNSYSRDALSYVPFILESIYNINVTIGILYKGSCTLQQHYELINNNTAYEAFDFYQTGMQCWSTATTGDSRKINTILSKYKWDIITLQQQSSNSRDYSTYQPYLNDIISLLLQKIDYNIKLGWILTPSYPTGYSGLGTDTSDEMFTKICSAVERVMNETAVNFFIPCGTAIQNARYATPLKDLGDFGGLTYEGLHLQEGIPCLLEAYITSQCILDIMGEKYKGVFGNQIRPTQSWIESKNIPQPNGNSVGVTDSNCMLAQKIVAISLKKPLVITDIDSLNL